MSGHHRSDVPARLVEVDATAATTGLRHVETFENSARRRFVEAPANARAALLEQASDTVATKADVLPVEMTLVAAIAVGMAADAGLFGRVAGDQNT